MVSSIAIVTIDICIHLTQSVCGAWHAKPSLIKDPECTLSINFGSHAASRTRLLGVQNQVPREKMTAHLKKWYVLRASR